MSRALVFLVLHYVLHEERRICAIYSDRTRAVRYAKTYQTKLSKARGWDRLREHMDIETWSVR